MTIDNETSLTVYRPLSDVLDSYRPEPGDLEVLALAFTRDAKAFALAVKKGDMDKAHGIANRIYNCAARGQRIASQSATEI